MDDGKSKIIFPGTFEGDIVSSLEGISVFCLYHLAGASLEGFARFTERMGIDQIPNQHKWE